MGQSTTESICGISCCCLILPNELKRWKTRHQLGQVVLIIATRTASDLLVHGERSLLVLLLLVLVFGRLVQGLEPDVAERDERVGVVARLRLLQDPLELLLPGAPFHLGQVKVADQGPAIWMLVTNLQWQCRAFKFKVHSLDGV